MENTGIKKAKELLKAISQDEEEIRKAEMREKFIRDQHAIMLAGIEQIEKITGLSKEEIEKIVKK